VWSLGVLEVCKVEEGGKQSSSVRSLRRGMDPDEFLGAPADFVVQYLDCRYNRLVAAKYVVPLDHVTVVHETAEICVARNKCGTPDLDGVSLKTQEIGAAEIFVACNESVTDVEGRSMGVVSLKAREVWPVAKRIRSAVLLVRIAVREATAAAQHEPVEVLPQTEGLAVELLGSRTRPMGRNAIGGR
jgi:hypothetical protein